jgi:hypothetical protein
MRSPIVLAGVLAALSGCSETTSTSVADAADVVDVVDVVDASLVDAMDASDASDVVDASDVPDGPRVDVMDAVDASDVVDVPVDDGAAADIANDTGVRCGATETPCMSGATVECVGLQFDSRHCGACGHACCPGQSCSAGSCVTGCSAGQTVCTPAGATCPLCVDASTSTAHCGRCNFACAAGQVCALGACVAPVCATVTEPPPPMGQCDGRGRIACEMWAQSIAGGRTTVTAQCLTSPSGCAKADRCDDARDASTCRCGAGPSCGPNEVCELVGPTARCQCARR